MENIIELMGGYVDEDEGRIREMWKDVFKDKSFDKCRRVSKKEFILLMKGQRQERRPSKSIAVDEMPPILDMVDQDSSRALTLPESDATSPGAQPVVKALNDEEATPLVVNRILYRAHRQSRLAVLEASRRFEEEQMKRTAKTLNQALNTGNNVSSSNLYRASLIMRHSQNAAASSDSVRSMVKQAQDEMQTKIDVAKRRSGRRHDRKKSVSNLAEMCCETLPPHLAATIDSLPPNSKGSTSSVGRSRGRGRRKMASSLEGMFSFDPNSLTAHAEDECHTSDSSHA